ncbi:hypothetical protein JD844_033820 [Phrynosoma platyrhinos]|uniref:Zinc finger RING-type eukaryotic domain-containing protein n=1 Tax=Phrynosoma platyrhinos TaxID=52577 RepID=A0ABQ7T770_PHRPL|nr:hypothetical protein JD844_033820 [Phrynosoma platyrhinos]
MAKRESSSSPVVRQIDKQFLVCSICLDRYHNPKVLPCLHTFCERHQCNFADGVVPWRTTCLGSQSSDLTGVSSGCAEGEDDDSGTEAGRTAGVEQEALAPASLVLPTWKKRQHTSSSAAAIAMATCTCL